MEELYNVLEKYFGALVKTGYIPIKIVENIIILDFLNELEIDQELPLIATCEQLDKICKLRECVKQNNCLI